MKEQLLHAWQIHNEKNLLLLQQLDEAALELRLNKGRTIGQQLAHLHNNRINWFSFVAKDLYSKTDLIAKEAVLTIALLQTAFLLSSEKMQELIQFSWENEGRLPSFKSGLIAFISYHISHESHHRGAILLTLKQSAHVLPDELRWGLWEWGK